MILSIKECDDVRKAQLREKLKEYDERVEMLSCGFLGISRFMERFYYSNSIIVRLLFPNPRRLAELFRLFDREKLNSAFAKSCILRCLFYYDKEGMDDLDTELIKEAMLAISPERFDEILYDKAVIVIEDYIRTGGAFNQGGTGLPRIPARWESTGEPYIAG